jgi:hypothetical protein
MVYFRSVVKRTQSRVETCANEVWKNLIALVIGGCVCKNDFIWNIPRPFGIFMAVWYVWTMKNLATLVIITIFDDSCLFYHRNIFFHFEQTL